MYLKTIFLTSFMTPFDTLTEHFLYKKPLNKQRLITIWPFILTIFIRFFIKINLTRDPNITF